MSSSKSIFQPSEDSGLPTSIVGTLSTEAGFSALEAHSGPLPCDWVEFRGDQLHAETEKIFSLSTGLRSRGIETIYTLRLESEGGAAKTDDSLRYQALCDALPYVSAVDIEVASPFAVDMVEDAAKAGKGVILSSHDFTCVPDVEDVLNRFKTSKGEHVLLKVAGFIRNQEDLWKLVDIQRVLSNRQACVMGMGERGARSRIVLAGLGSLLTYGYLDQSAAPGQLSCEELRSIFQEGFRIGS